jgi:hypothetical protein
MLNEKIQAPVGACACQKISLKTPVNVSNPTMKMMAMTHRIIFIVRSFKYEK